MKKNLFAGLFLLTAFAAFSQRLSTVAVFPFEAAGGITAADALGVTGQVIAELSSWGTLRIVEEDQAETAEYLVRGQLSKTNSALVLTATTFDAKTGKALNSSKEQAANLSGLAENMFSFCGQVVENVPFPNYLLGKWKAAINLGDGPLICILEFRSDRTVLAEQYDTYEHRANSGLKYQGYGSGTYSYRGHVRRILALKDAQGNVYREAPVDGLVSITLSLEDALPKYGSLSQSRISLCFDEDKNNFELVSAGLLCGENFGGPAVYPQTTVAYTRFTKIQ
jgi:hypothetical protein